MAELPWHHSDVTTNQIYWRIPKEHAQEIWAKSDGKQARYKQKRELTLALVISRRIYSCPTRLSLILDVSSLNIIRFRRVTSQPIRSLPLVKWSQRAKRHKASKWNNESCLKCAILQSLTCCNLRAPVATRLPFQAEVYLSTLSLAFKFQPLPVKADWVIDV